MAGKTDAAKGKGKGVAFAKWAKIDSAQRNMFLAVCGASIVLGITVVGIVYFAKVIAFNGKLIGEKDQVIKDYKSIQTSLENISNSVRELATNESLEAVGRTRATDCLSRTNENILGDDAIQDVELARVCTALRVIPDAIPSSENLEATMSSVNQLLLWSDPSLRIEGIVIQELETDETISVEHEDGTTTPTTLKPIGASVSLDDSVPKVQKAMDTIENSIRNFDIMSATIEYSGEDFVYSDTVKLSAIYRSYYSSSINIEKKSKKVCADDTSEKCTGRRSR